MKNVIFIFSLFLLLGTSKLSAQTAKTVSLQLTEEEAPFSFNKTVHQFGEIPQNVPAAAEFTITNNSNEPLLLTKVKGSCGCTVPTYNKNAIAPGESTVVTATYNAKKMGNFNKTVSVITNQNEQPVLLKIKGNVTENRSLVSQEK